MRTSERVNYLPLVSVDQVLMLLVQQRPQLAVFGYWVQSQRLHSATGTG